MPTIGETSRPGFVYDSATDTWIPVGIGPHAHTPAAIGAIASSVVTTKGDLIVATGSGTVVRQGVGADGSMLVANSAEADGVSYALGNAYAAGKNKIINGDFSVWQRGAGPFTLSQVYSADRYTCDFGGSSSSISVTRQQFTAGSPPVPYAERRFFYRYNQSTAGSGQGYCTPLIQKIENVQTFAGQTITISFWAKVDSARTLNVVAVQWFDNSTDNVQTYGTNQNITTSWARYSYTITIPSISSSQTIGANSSFWVGITSQTLNAVQVIDIWGLQAEFGSVATPFQTATGSIQGELAACCYYYERLVSDATFTAFGSGYYTSGSRLAATVNYQRKRTAPLIAFSNVGGFYGAGSVGAASIATSYIGKTSANLDCSISGASTSTGFGGVLSGNNSASAYIELNSEL
jgi:hypothetical protein